MAYDNQVGFFNLNNDGDSATIRLLHTKVSTIEKATVHPIMVDNKKRTIGCCGENCPFCARGIKAGERIYIHLWDYADNKEKIWNRTPTILPQLSDLESSWGDLSNIVLKVTRRGKDFPKYELMIMPPNNYAMPAKDLIDKQIAYRYYMHRSVDELNTFLSTGIMPQHESKPYVSKEEYMRQKNAEKAQQSVPNSVPNVSTYTPPATPYPTSVSSAQSVSRNDDVFIDPFESIKPRRV